jgi:site-specific recombinase XerD
MGNGGFGKAIIEIERLKQFSVWLYDAVRHSFASRLINLGMSVYSVSCLLRHSNNRTTETFLHSDLEKLKIDVSCTRLMKK